MSGALTRGMLSAVLCLASCLYADLGTAQTAVKYVHTDVLGSVVAVTDADRNIVERREYEPFGRQLNPLVEDGPGYTGHVQDSATDLIYMQQRYYDPGIGRFLSVDSMSPLGDSVALFNRYNYGGNNPANATDPDGRRCVIANASSVYCMRRDIYNHFDRRVGSSTRFFGAAAATVQYLANSDIPVLGSLGGSSESRIFLHQVSSALYSLNAKTYSDILGGSLSGPNLDSMLVHMEQTAVQEMLDALPADQRGRIIESINSSFEKRSLASIGDAGDRRYNKILDRVEKDLGGPIDFGSQSDREAIGNALINDLRSSGACTTTGTRIRSC